MDHRSYRLVSLWCYLFVFLHALALRWLLDLTKPRPGHDYVHCPALGLLPLQCSQSFDDSRSYGGAGFCPSLSVHLKDYQTSWAVLVKTLSRFSVSSLALGDCVSEEVTPGPRARSSNSSLVSLITLWPSGNSAEICYPCWCTHSYMPTGSVKRKEGCPGSPTSLSVREACEVDTGCFPNRH